MAPRTLASTWRQLERLSRAVLDSESVPDEALIQDFAELASKANRSRIVDALGTLFVQGFPGTEGVGVRFLGGQDALVLGQPTAYKDDEKVILINPVGVVRFIDECERSAQQSNGGDAEASEFRHQRLQAYQAELSKLPSQILLFLTLLRQVGEVLDVTTSDRRGTRAAAEGDDDKPYLMLLWAFKQLEAMYRDMKGVSLRSEYSILWYESDWATGRR